MTRLSTKLQRHTRPRHRKQKRANALLPHKQQFYKMLRTIALKDLNPNIICVLCSGYLVDATTIIECLHSFCRGCIVRFLETSYHCPVCDVEIHKTRPLLNIRADHVLQDIVYKLVPGLYYEEKSRRENIEEKLKPANLQLTTIPREDTKDTPKEEEEEEKKSSEFDIEDPVCITLEFYRRQRNTFEKQIFPTRYLRCSSSITVRVLKKFLTIKFGIPATHKSELVRCDEILEDHLTIKDLKRIYGLYTKPFIDLQYLFIAEGMDKGDADETAQQAKRIKTAHQQKQQELFMRYKKQQQRRLELERQELREEQERRQRAQEGQQQKYKNEKTLKAESAVRNNKEHDVRKRDGNVQLEALSKHQEQLRSDQQLVEDTAHLCHRQLHRKHPLNGHTCDEHSLAKMDSGFSSFTSESKTSEHSPLKMVNVISNQKFGSL